MASCSYDLDPGKKLWRRATHGLEGSFIAGGFLKGSWGEPDADDWKLVATMSSYWTQFAKTGEPNQVGLPAWPVYDPLLNEVGLKSALSEYVQGFGERSKISVTLELPRDLERQPREVELTLFRIVQECLTNVHRHSGSHTARVSVSCIPGEIQVEVSDQGCGIKAEIQENFLAGRSTGVGLRGMRERVRQIGGALQIQSNGNGASVLVVLPIRATDTESENVTALRKTAVSRRGSFAPVPCI